jgi:hypothetical protein
MANDRPSADGGGEFMERRVEQQSAYALGMIHQSLVDIKQELAEQKIWMIQLSGDLRHHTEEDLKTFGRVERSMTWMKAQLWGVGIVFAAVGGLVIYWMEQLIDKVVGKVG